MPIVFAIRLAVSYSAMVLAFGSHTGRVTPRETMKRPDSSSPLVSASMRSTPPSRSLWRLAMLSASPAQALDTQFTHWPPWITPTLNVQASVVIPSICGIISAMMRIAERPSLSREPAWLGRPMALRLKRAIA